MRWWTSCTMCVLLGSLSATQGQDSSLSGGSHLIRRSQCAQFAITLGRLRLDSSRYNKIRREEPIVGTEVGTEYVSVTAEKGRPSLHYLRHTNESRLNLDISDTSELHLEFQVLDGPRAGEAMTLHQPAAGVLTWTITMPQRSAEEVKGESLWHLQAARGEAFDQWLRPILNQLLPPTHAVWSHDELDRELLAQVSATPTIQWSRVSELVHQLGSKRRTDRIEAQRTLIQYGVGVLPLLRAFDPETLDAEQRERLREIRGKLEPQVSDRPELIAQWLSTDHAYWTLAASRWQVADRKRVARHLELAAGRSLPVELLFPYGKEIEVNTEVAAAPSGLQLR